MISLPSGARVWLACGHTDMRKGMDGLAKLAPQVLEENPFSGVLFVFRGGGLVELLWFDGQDMCLFSKRLERGHFVQPATNAGRVNTLGHSPKAKFVVTITEVRS
jgi:transposase